MRCGACKGRPIADNSYWPIAGRSRRATSDARHLERTLTGDISPYGFDLKNSLVRSSLRIMSTAWAMDITVKHVSASGEGDYFGMSFDNDDPDDDGQDYEPSGPYLIVQRQFEDGDDRICYVETHDEDYCGHFKVRLVTFSDTRFAMELVRRRKKLISVSYDLSKQDFEAVERIVNVIFGDLPIES